MKNKSEKVMKTVTIILAFLLPCLFFTSCNKNDKFFLGEWKMTKVIIIDTTIVDGHYQQFEVDYSENNIIYTFQKNNKLIVTNSNSQKNKYKYEVEQSDVTCHTPYSDMQIKIDNGEYFHLQISTMNSPEYEAMSISGRSANLKKTVDEADLMIIEQSPFCSWRKIFIR